MNVTIVGSLSRIFLARSLYHSLHIPNRLSLVLVRLRSLENVRVYTQPIHHLLIRLHSLGLLVFFRMWRELCLIVSGEGTVR